MLTPKWKLLKALETLKKRSSLDESGKPVYREDSPDNPAISLTTYDDVCLVCDIRPIPPREIGIVVSSKDMIFVFETRKSYGEEKEPEHIMTINSGKGLTFIIESINNYYRNKPWDYFHGKR